MDEFKPLIAKVATGASLSRAEAVSAFDTMLSGGVTSAQAGAFLMALRVRGETVDEIAGAVTAMRDKMLRVEAPDGAIDIVGTGGDGSGSYNVSTLAAIIAAACGVPVAKHGNRAASSKSGAADVLTALGVKVGIDAPGVARCIREVGPVRVEMGTRTIFNVLGPLSNPAGVKRQMIGVFAESWLEPMAQVLKSLGSEHVWLVNGSDGLDEITTTGPTRAIELKNGKIHAFTIDAEKLGLQRATIDDLKGGDAAYNAQALRAVLYGEKIPYRDIALINAAAGLVVAGRATELEEGLALAAKAVDSGAAARTLDKLVAVSNA